MGKDAESILHLAKRQILKLVNNGEMDSDSDSRNAYVVEFNLTVTKKEVVGG